jgi:hypothetical protein
MASGGRKGHSDCPQAGQSLRRFPATASGFGILTRVSALSYVQAATKDRLHTVARSLAQTDHDIWNLMGARDLYIAEIYDVAKNGDTQKPFGRVFYTRGKSLVFYAYDLDQQPGLRQVSTFQVWTCGKRFQARSQPRHLLPGRHQQAALDIEVQRREDSVADRCRICDSRAEQEEREAERETSAVYISADHTGPSVVLIDVDRADHRVRQR